MKRYALLSGPTYYPSPGWHSFRSWHDSIVDAVFLGKQHAKEDFGWYQVLDTTTFEIVAGEGAGHSGLFGLISAK